MPKQRRSLKRKSRAHKRLQREPIAPTVREALETEAWLRSNARTTGSSIAMQDIVEEIVRWFVARAEKMPPTYKPIRHTAPTLSFWLDVDLVARCRALARRDAVTKRRVIGTAFIVYSQEMIPSSTKALRRHTMLKSEAIFRRCRGAPKKSSKHTRGSR